jgi:UDP-2,3-diacylglucosamine pyrophosphatase LpxH
MEGTLLTPAAAKFRSLFISDVHLGSPGCQASLLMAFLRRFSAETLFLVGDIFDAESLARRFYWPQAHNEVLRALLDHARCGTRIVYIPGNHDIQARAWCGLTFGRIEIRRQLLHTTAAGKRYLVLHGDQFDRHLDRSAWRHRLGAVTYRALVQVNSRVNAWRQRNGLGYWPIASEIKHRSRSARQYIDRFRTTALAHAAHRRVDGCVVGHIHRPEMRTENGIDYLNCGDWVEHCTALAEHADGRMELIEWPGHAFAPSPASRLVAEAA